MTAAAGAPPRPTLLTALAWIWIVLGALATLTSLFVAAALLLVPGGFAPRLPEGQEGTPDPDMAVIDWLFAHFELLAAFQLLVAVTILVGGIYLLKQRAWARTLLETIAWLGIAYSLVWTAWFANHWLTVTGAVPADATADPEVVFFRFFGVAAAVMSVLFYAGPLGVLIWMLRHRTVRGALVRGAHLPGSGVPGAGLPGDGTTGP